MKKLFILPLLLLLAAGCRRDGDPAWDTGLVVPVAHASLSINQLVADSLVSVNPDGSVRLVYSTDFGGFSTDTLFDIPDTTISNLYPMPFLQYQLQGGDNFPIPPSTPTTYALGSVQLVSGILQAGHIDVVLRNDIRRKIVVRYQIPSASKNNIPFDTSFTVPAAPDSLNHTFMNASIDLAGYTVDFTGNGNQVNTIITQISAMVAIGEPVTTVYQNETVGAITTFAGIRPFYIRGYFGNQTTAIGPEESDFTAFSRVLSGALGLDSLTMSLHVDNYVGMDSRLTINNIWSRNTRTGQSVYLANSLLGSPININRASYTNSWPPAAPSSYNFVFNNGNSNAKALVENMPDKFGYDLTLVTNPLGNVSGNNDFFYSDFGILARLDVEMPLNFSAGQIVLGDTIETDLSTVRNKENVGKGTLTLYAQNSFPFAAGIQVYLLDASNQVTDSLVAMPNTIQPGPTAASGPYVVSSGFTSSVISIPMSAGQAQRFLESPRVYFKVILNTSNTPALVKIYDTNRLDLQLTADFDYHVGD